MSSLLSTLVSFFSFFFFFFFFNDPSTTEIYTLSLHDALPILRGAVTEAAGAAADVVSDVVPEEPEHAELPPLVGDRKSTRLNSSHQIISYAVFCLKKKKNKKKNYMG